uniref:Uncharacterized protein n=1 Tax=Ciona intestinalis TaxID=7719 RepID=H2XP12_CIOIN
MATIVAALKFEPVTYGLESGAVTAGPRHWTNVK